MKCIFLVMGMVLMGPDAFSQNKDVVVLKGLNQAWLDCYPTKDTTTLGGILADDFQLIAPSGAKMSKNDVLKNVATGDPATAVLDSVEVRMLTSDAAIITAYLSFTIHSAGQAVSARNCYQDVYLKKAGKWRAVAAHVTVLAAKQAAPKKKTNN